MNFELKLALACKLFAVFTTLSLYKYTSRYSKIFHPHHCLLLQIKARLTKAYGNEKGFLRHQMDQEDVQRKLEVRLNKRTIETKTKIWATLRKSS